MRRGTLSILIVVRTALLSAALPTTAEDPQTARESRRSGVVEMGRPTHQILRDVVPETVGPNVNTTMSPAAQNESSVAADPANPMNLVGGSNDYRYGDSGGRSRLGQRRDGGLSFKPNVRVSDEISDASNDGFGGAFIGDYNGIASSIMAAKPEPAWSRSAVVKRAGPASVGRQSSNGGAWTVRSSKPTFGHKAEVLKPLWYYAVVT